MPGILIPRQPIYLMEQAEGFSIQNMLIYTMAMSVKYANINANFYDHRTTSNYLVNCQSF